MICGRISGMDIFEVSDTAALTFAGRPETVKKQYGCCLKTDMETNEKKQSGGKRDFFDRTGRF